MTASEVDIAGITDPLEYALAHAKRVRDGEQSSIHIVIAHLEAWVKEEKEVVS
jgi:hypothetical protein